MSLSLGAVAQEYDITAIVAAQDAYLENNTKATRSALLDALVDYPGEPTVETVKAHLALMVNDTTAGESKDMLESATAARDHLEPVSNLLPKQYAEARYISAVATFNENAEADAMSEMAHVEGFTNSQRDESGEQPDWARDLKWKAAAWGMAIDAYFESSNKRHPDESDIQQILASYGADEASVNAVAAQSIDDNGLPFCSGRMIQKPKMRYPAGKAMRGMYGAVILGLEFDPAGNVVNPRVLASVPFEEFDDRSLRTVGKWKFKPNDASQVNVTCRLQRTDVVQPLVFLIR